MDRFPKVLHQASNDNLSGDVDAGIAWSLKWQKIIIILQYTAG